MKHPKFEGPRKVRDSNRAIITKTVSTKDKMDERGLTGIVEKDSLPGRSCTVQLKYKYFYFQCANGLPIAALSDDQIRQETGFKYLGVDLGGQVTRK